MNSSSRNVLIFGGSGVIGREISLRFAKENWSIGVHYCTHKLRAKKTVDLVRKNAGTAITLQADIRHANQIGCLIETIMKKWGRIDVVVCATGQAINGLAMRFRKEHWVDMIQTNLTGVFLIMKSLAPILQTQGHGSVIIVNSLSSVLGTKGHSAYSACKAGILGLMKSAAYEWGPSNIQINVVFPGWHQSPLSAEAFPTPSNLTNHVLGRTPNLNEVANLVYQIAISKDISGQVFNLDSRIW